MSAENYCSATVVRSNDFYCLNQYYDNKCSRRGIIFYEGKYYCKQHDPEAVKKRDDERLTKWHQEREEKARNRIVIDSHNALISVLKQFVSYFGSVNSIPVSAATIQADSAVVQRARAVLNIVDDHESN